MNCSDVDRVLLDEPLPSRLPSEAQEHLCGCRRCREFLRALNSSVSPESPSPTTLRRIQQAISADLQPVHPVASKRSIVGALVAIYACIVAVAAYRFGASALSVMGLLPAGAIFGTLAISAALLAHSLAQQMVPGSQHRIPPELLPAGIMVVLMFAVAVSFPFRDERSYWANAWGCLRAGARLGAFAAIPFWLVLRQGSILAPVMTGATTGLLAGLVGTSVLEIHCPNMDAWHVLASHLGVAALGGIAGFTAGLIAEIAGTRSLARRASSSRGH